MRKIIYALWLTVALLCSSTNGLADPATDKRDVTALIQQLYREPEQGMSVGRFNGKFDPKRQCALLKQYVHESLIKQEKLPSGKEICESLFDRFPGYTLQDDMGGWDAPPKHKLFSVSVNGDLAEAVVEMPEYYPTIEKKYHVARVEAYLKRFPQGWRIYAARIYDRYVHPEDIRFLPGTSPRDLYIGSEEGQPPGELLPANRPNK